MHAGVNAKLMQSLERIVHNILFTQYADRDRSTSHNAITNEVVKMRQDLV